MVLKQVEHIVKVYKAHVIKFPPTLNPNMRSDAAAST